MTKSVYPSKALIRPTTSSGKEVPIETMVKPITSSETFNFFPLKIPKILRKILQFTI